MNLILPPISLKKFAYCTLFVLATVLFRNVAIAQNTVSGTVYNDIDGSAKGTFSNIQTGSETGTNGNGTLRVYVVSLLDIIVAKSTVAANGTYTSSMYSALLNATVYLVLDTVSRNVGDQILPFASIKMPAAWANTSPFMTGGILTLGGNLTNRNFGIQRNGFLTIPDFSICASSDSLFTWYFRGSRTNLFTGNTVVENSGASAKLPFFKVTARYFTNNDSYSTIPTIFPPATYTIAGAGGSQPVPTSLQYQNPVLEIDGSSLLNGVNTDSVGISVAFKNTNGKKLYIQKLNNAVLDLDTYESLKVTGYNNGTEVKPIIYASNGYADNTTNDMRSFYINNTAWMFGLSSGYQSLGACNAWCDYNYNAFAIMEFPTPVDSIFYTARITEPTGNRDYLAGSLGSNEITGFNYCPVTIQGKLWNDANSNGIMDGSEANISNSGAFINMIDEYGTVLATTQILADGTYSFPNLPQLATIAKMKLQISTTQGIVGNIPPITSVPYGYISVSENVGGSTPEINALADKEIALPSVLSSNLSNYNFGVKPTGYIYVQKKALDETSSIDFSFVVSEGPTAVPSFNLNDKDNQMAIKDIGASQSGRLWAVGKDNVLYYRDLGASAWVASSVIDANKVDGGPGNSCYYLRNTYDPYYFDGTTSTLLGNWDAFGNYPAFDIGSAWNNQPYITTDEGTIWQYSGSGTTWAQVGTDVDNRYIDGNPANGNAIVTKDDNTIWSFTGAGAGTSLGKPANATDPTAVAVTSDGSIFGGFAVPSLNSNNYAFKWISGSTWSAEEITSREYVTGTMTAGIGGQVWGIYSGGATSPVNQNIFTRTFDGTTTLWLNDERVRETITGNSVMMAVDPGTYKLTELVPTGWDLQNINVYDPTNNSSKSIIGNSATLVVAAGETVSALFENGLVRPFPMTNSCADPYLEDFGTGASSDYGLPLKGQTSYHYQTTDNTLANNYKVIGNANMLFGGAANLNDHTAGDGEGRMMAVDANNEKDAFFRRRFTGIIPGATYNFSAWIANINAPAKIKPNVTFEVINPVTYKVLQSVNTNQITNSAWAQFGLTFMADTTTLDLVIRNNSFGGSGNDLAIDDISFSMLPVPAPITTVTNTGCGTLGGIEVTFPLGNAYEYSIDSFKTAPHPSPLFDNLTAGIYTVSVRFVGTVNCFTSKTDTVGATICGTIWNDANGDAINNSENPMTSGVWVNLVNTTTHTVLQSVEVDALGSYNFTSLLPDTDFQIILTNANQTYNTSLTSATLPTDYTVTGTNIAGTASTLNTTGLITLNTGRNGLTGQNFGIEKFPDSDPKTQSVDFPTGGIISAGTVTTPVSGTDAEDGPLGNSNTIVITNPPTNATMRYQGILVAPGQLITGFNPALISYSAIAEGSTSVAFNYTFIDAAGQLDPSPAAYTISWLKVLPIKLESFTINTTNCSTAELKWELGDASNFNYFEVERSYNRGAFQATGIIMRNTAQLVYSFKENNLAAGQYQYRLKMVDSDGKIEFSPIGHIRIDCNLRTLSAYPNPAKDKVTISGLNAGEQITMYNASGQIVQTKIATNYQLDIQLSTLANGTYHIIVTTKTGKKISESKIVKTN